jgi:hypothetical protein
MMQIVTRFYLMFSWTFWCKLYSLPLNLCKSSRCCVVLKLIFSPFYFIFSVALFILLSCCPIGNLIYLSIRYPLSNMSENKQLVENRFFSLLCSLFALLMSVFIVYILLLSSNSIFMGMSYMVQFLVYFILVAMPHLYSTQLRIFLIFTATVAYISKFFLEFFQLYRLLLQKIMQIKVQTK